jgi:CheY-like chemotaxis protein
LNLIGNAIKFTKAGSIQVTVEADKNPAAFIENEMPIRFSVKDTGIGLSPETQKKLFQPFAQGDNSTSRQFGGTGLGLSISRSLIELMSGEIGVESEEGNGSCFWFKISLKTVNTVVTSTLPSGPISLKPSTPRTKRIRVLVAEDNTTNQLVVMAHLRALGIDGQTVANGQEVLAALCLLNFDIILMDCHMPVMDGYTATAKIRESEKVTGDHIPIVALTANAMQDDEGKCLRAGMDAFISKPFKREALLQVLDRLLPDKDEAGTKSA